MGLTKEEIKDIVTKYGKDLNDTGRTEVQIVLLTKRIEKLSKHFATHKKDLLTRKNFLQLIGQRRRLLKYLKKIDKERYEKLVKELGL